MPLKDPIARAEYQKKYAERRKEALRAYRAAYRQKNSESIKEKKRAYWDANKEVLQAKLRARYASDPERWKLYNRMHYRENSEIAKQYSQRYRANNPEQVKATKKHYAVKNKHVINASVAKRKAIKLQRTPAWVNSEEMFLIKEVYGLASIRTKMTGFAWHVDHIIPLQGEKVSGLHTVANLQVIPAIDNIRKYNTYEVV